MKCNVYVVGVLCGNTLPENNIKYVILAQSPWSGVWGLPDHLGPFSFVLLPIGGSVVVRWLL